MHLRTSERQTRVSIEVEGHKCARILCFMRMRKNEIILECGHWNGNLAWNDFTGTSDWPSLERLHWNEA